MLTRTHYLRRRHFSDPDWFSSSFLCFPHCSAALGFPPDCREIQGLNSLNHGKEAHPTSIVINVTINIKPSGQQTENITQEERKSSCFSSEEMEDKLQTIWEKAQGDGVETLDYDSVQDLSLLLDSEDDKKLLRGLGRSLGVPPQLVPHHRGFQDLFQYLRTSTSTLLAQAAALLPNPEVVARTHRAVVEQVTTHPLRMRCHDSSCIVFLTHFA